MNCCNPMTGKCEQGHGCPVRCTHAAAELPQPTYLGNTLAETMREEATKPDYQALRQATRYAFAFLLGMFTTGVIVSISKTLN